MSDGEACFLPGDKQGHKELAHHLLALVDSGGPIQAHKRIIVCAAQGCDEVQRLCVVGHDHNFVIGAVPQDVKHLGHDSELA